MKFIKATLLLVTLLLSANLSYGQFLFNEGWTDKDELNFNPDSIKKYRIKNLIGTGFTLPAHGKSFANQRSKHYYFSEDGKLSFSCIMVGKDTNLITRYHYKDGQLSAQLKINNKSHLTQKRLFQKDGEQLYVNGQLKSQNKKKVISDRQVQITYYGAGSSPYARSTQYIEKDLIFEEKRFNYLSKTIIDSCFIQEGLIIKKSWFDTKHRKLRTWKYTYAQQQLSEWYYYDGPHKKGHRNFIYRNGVLNNESYTNYDAKDIHWFSYEASYYEL